MAKDNRKPGSSFSAANPSVRSYAWLLQIVGVAAAYFVTGKLGTFLAIPPGYATAIWPPSGIALAGILIYGYRAWPGILLGSFLVNLSATLINGSPSETLTSVVTTLAIGGGASLQAVVGAYLVRRFAGFPNSLTREKEVFLLVMG
ncbi:MASE1 domain-containing protein [Methylobacter sp.]|uniref:MASE1 domain-containing protein n=1 Tax=Methylobacter sp. TaxID=2051955 RepID=UPI00248766D1|nr:MASE1 domain-containing protein [Methylobacter sp.]MDI1279758.1 MASE1 domain-containing protein [Methylobacter sp.]MDI1360423.1 MASE1 domain-containing protein [Methylobacter sp.]